MSRGQLEFIHNQGICVRHLIDCGPGVPNSEAWEAKKLWPAIEIVGFEPQPDRFRWLTLDDEHGRTSYPGWLFPYAVGAREEHAALKLIGAELNSGFYWDQPDLRARNVEIIRLDWFMKWRPDLSDAILWMDIEGSEYDALLGATETLKKCVAVVAEVWPEQVCQGWCTAAMVGHLLECAGFRKAAEFPSGGTDPQRDEVWLR